MPGPLGRLPPTDWRHYERHGLTADTAPATATPVVIGVNWYEAFDRPEQERKTRRWWIARAAELGRVRGGHCICIEGGGPRDIWSWHERYDQGQEGACVGFGCSRMMSLLNRRFYDAEWLYHYAQRVDEWPGEDYEGTSVRAGLEVLRTIGHKRLTKRELTEPESADGISAYRWARTVDEVHGLLRHGLADRLGAVPLLNSWGKSYPERVWLSDDVLQRLIDEDGEVGLVSDR